MEQLLGELREFKDRSLERFTSLEKKVDALYGFQMKITGMGIFIGFIVGAAVEWFNK